MTTWANATATSPAAVSATEQMHKLLNLCAFGRSEELGAKVAANGA